MSEEGIFGGAERRLVGKAAKKAKRSAAKVCDEYGIVFSNCQASRFLMVSNVGLMNGVSRDDLVHCFSRYADIENVLLIPQKTHCFVSLLNEDSATKAFENLNGKATIKVEDDEIITLYLCYVDRMPSSSEVENYLQCWCGSSKDRMPDGAALIDDFVTSEEEERLLKSLMFDDVQLKHRRVQHFGFTFVYGSNSIDTSEYSKAKPFPTEWSDSLEKSLKQGLVAELPDQCTANLYEPGQGIPPHVDTHSCCTGEIMSLSLGSDVVMDFVDLTAPSVTKHVLLKRRSLLVLAGKSRYAYSHGIATRKNDIVPDEDGFGLTLSRRSKRVSLTFRKTLNGPCKCQYPRFCDSQKDTKVNLTDKAAAELEKIHVHKVYEKIADHFSDTRHTQWPRVAKFVSGFSKADVIVDVGCGNGKYMRKDRAMIGCDRSSSLLHICRERGFQSVQCDCLQLPYKDECVDGVISIAVLHHLSTTQRRVKMVQEISRVLRLKGKALIYAWAKDQAKNDQPSTYLKTKPSAKPQEGEKMADTEFPLVLPVHKNRTNFEHSDLLVPWKKQKSDDVHHRYYHVFEEGELEDLISNVPTLTIADSWYDQGNWCVVLIKGSEM